VAQDARFDIAAASGGVSIQTLAGAGNVTLGSNTLTLSEIAAGASFSGVIGGNGGLAVQSSLNRGLTLSGANTYQGATTVGAGATLNFTGATSGLGGGMVNAGTVNFDQTADSSFGGAITGSGALNKNLASLLTLGGQGSSTGAVSVNAGTLELAGTGAFGAASFSNGATTTLDGSSRLVIGGVFDSSGASSVLNVAVGNNANGGAAIIAADSAKLGGTINLTGLAAPASAHKASDLNGAASTVLIHTTNGITGDATVNLGATTTLPDYLLAGGIKSGTDYKVGYSLAWFAGPINGSGTFTVNASDTVKDFDVDLALTDVDASGNVNTWDGKTLLKAGDGTLTLSADNGYSGVTTVSAGTLQIGNGGTTGSITGNVANDGTLAFNRADAMTFGGEIAGSGGVDQIGAGTLTLSGASRYSGATRVLAGTLNVTGSLGDTATTVGNRGTLTGTGSIGGAVTVESGGTFKGSAGSVLGTGALTLEAGAVVSVALGAPSGSGLFKVNGDVTLNGASTLAVSDAGGFGDGLYRVIDYSGALRGSGSLDVGDAPTGYDLSVVTSTARQINLDVARHIDSGDTGGDTGGGSGDTGGNTGGAPGGGDTPPPNPDPKPDPTPEPTPLAGNNYWNGGTTHADGTVNGGSGTWSSGTANWTDANGATSGTQNADSTLVFSGNAGSVTVDGEQSVNGGLQFAADGYHVREGRLVLGAGTHTLRVGDGTNDGAGFTATIDTPLSGAGGIAKDDLGTLVLDGANDYSGGTHLRHGTLVGSAASFGSGAIVFDEIAGQANPERALVVDQAGDGAMGNSLQGSGQFDKTGAGRLNYTGDGSGFTGATTVREGTLAVNGSLAGSTVTVEGGARAGGNGTLGGLVVKSGGTAAPGNSIGRLHVAGDVRFEAGSVYEVETDAAGNADRISASGAATIQGGTVSVKAGEGNYAANTRYTILDADGGVTGQFTQVQSNLAFLTPTLSYHASAVDLALTRNDVSFVEVGGSRNQRAAGAAIEALGAGHAVYDAVLGNLDAAGAREAFDRLSGEVLASTQTALMEDSRLVREAALARPTTAQGTQGWAQIVGHRGRTDGNGNAAQLQRETAGALLGVDTSLGENARVGGLMGYTRGEFEVGQRASASNSDNVHVGAHVGSRHGAISLRAGAALTWHDIHSQRDIRFAGYADRVTGSAQARTAQVFGEAGYAVAVGAATLEPYASLAAARLKTEGLSEKGGAAALDAGAQTLDTRFTTLGLRASGKDFDLAGKPATFSGGIGWRHAFGDTTPVTQLSFAGGPAFSVQGVPIARNATLVEAGLDLRLSPQATLSFGYSGQFASGSSDNGLRLGLNVRF
jgi:outer membrane autotransporter protein